MINKIKVFFCFCILVFGLTGCIVVADDEPMYSSYPVGSYELASDYYHRPPAPPLPQSYYHKYHGSNVVHKKHGDLKHKPKDIVKPKPRDITPPKPKDVTPPKPKDVTPPKPKDVVKPKDNVKPHDLPKNKVDKKDPLHDFSKQNHHSPVQNVKINKPEPMPIKDKNPTNNHMHLRH